MGQGITLKNSKKYNFLLFTGVLLFFTSVFGSSSATAAAYITNISIQGDASSTEKIMGVEWAGNTHYYLLLKVKLQGSSSYVTKKTVSNAPSGQYMNVNLPSGTHSAYLTRCDQGTMGYANCSNSTTKTFTVPSGTGPYIQYSTAYAQQEFTRSYQTRYIANTYYYLGLQARFQGSSSFVEIGWKVNAASTGTFNYSFPEGNHQLRLFACKKSTTTGEPVNCKYSDTFDLSVTLVNAAPTITSIGNVTASEDTTSTVSFTIGDDYTSASDLTLSSGAGNSNFSGEVSISFGGSGANRTVTLRPPANGSGSIDIGVIVTDGVGKSSSKTFKYTVNPVNDRPTISAISNRTISEDQNTGNIGFTVSDVDNSASSLTVTASSSNTNLVPSSGISLGGSGSSRTIKVTPAANKYGSATISVTVSDGALTSTTSFVVTVNSVNDAPTFVSFPSSLAGVNEDSGNVQFNFSISDVETAVNNLGVTISSSNSSITPNLSVSTSGSTRTATIGLGQNKHGPVTIMVRINDGTTTVSRSVTLSVYSVNDLPTLSNFQNISVGDGFSTGQIPFTVGDVETSPSSLQVSVSAVSSGTTVVTPNVMKLSGGGITRYLEITPLANTSGQATITVKVKDADNAEVSKSFVLTVTEAADTVIFVHSDLLGTPVLETDVSGNAR